MTASRFILLGAGGHAKVLLGLARAAGASVLGVCDPELVRQGIASWRGLRVLGGDEALKDVDPREVLLINGLGQLVIGRGRRRLHDELSAKGFRFPALVHPAAWVDPTAQVEDGVQIMAGAVVQADCHLGAATIVNTRASVDHDCRVGPHVHVAPGATLCGGVTVREGAFIGAGACVIPGLSVGERSVIAAGTVLVRHLPDDHVMIGTVCKRREPQGTP